MYSLILIWMPNESFFETTIAISIDIWEENICFCFLIGETEEMLIFIYMRQRFWGKEDLLRSEILGEGWGGRRDVAEKERKKNF